MYNHGLCALASPITLVFRLKIDVFGAVLYGYLGYLGHLGQGREAKNATST